MHPRVCGKQTLREAAQGLASFFVQKHIIIKNDKAMNNVRKYIGYQENYDFREYEPIRICILDSGITGHTDFDRRIICFRDFVGDKISLYDDYGHGTHIAGICAGSGYKSIGKYQGIAPWSDLVVGKVLGENGDGKIEHLLRGILWCIKYQKELRIKVLNISVGLMQRVDEKKQKALMDAVEHAWDSGIVTICAAGNNGPKQGSVTIPGANAKIITVGSVEGGKTQIAPSKYSGRGPTGECVIKPEIYAPGDQIVSCSHTGWYTKKTGTSMSVPVVSGAVALLLQKYPYLSPVDIKVRLLYRSTKDNANKNYRVLYLPNLFSANES